MENAKTTIKFVASQAKSMYHYKSLRSKILKCKANIYFNRQCLTKNLTPKYAVIKIPTTSKAAQNTQNEVSHIRIKDEIKFLYKCLLHIGMENAKTAIKFVEGCVFIWMNIVKCAVGIRELGAEEDIWASEGRGNRGVAKIT